MADLLNWTSCDHITAFIANTPNKVYQVRWSPTFHVWLYDNRPFERMDMAMEAAQADHLREMQTQDTPAEGKIETAAGLLPEGDIKIDVEHVYGGWVGYVLVYPVSGPIVPAERESLYARTQAYPTREGAIAALPEAMSRISQIVKSEQE